MKLNKPNVLILVDWFTPGFRAGGPIRSVSNLVKSLQREFNFFIITSNKDLGAESSPYDVETNTWLYKENYCVYYACENPSVSFIIKAITEKNIDTVYLNSLFSKVYTISPLRRLKKLKNCPKIVLAPRGMLSPKALGIKWFKKSAFLLVAKWSGLYNGVTWHSTSPEESHDISTNFRTNTIVDAPNLGVLPREVININGKAPFIINIVSISRIARIKNLHLIIQALKKIPKDRTINYTHIGPIEDDEYWRECIALKSDLGSNISFNYAGERSYTEITSNLLNAQLLMLLSDSENFGHVVLEAFAHGVPCIVSDGTPWKNLEQKNIGFNLPIANVDEISAKMTYLCDMNATDFKKWSLSARRYAEDHIGNASNLKNYLRLFSGG